MPGPVKGGRRFPYPRHVENAYYRSLGAIFREWSAFPKQIDSLTELFHLMNRVQMFAPAQQVDALSRGMVTGVASANAAHWRIAALKSTQSNRIFHLLRQEMQGPVGATINAQIKQNATLIRTLPASVRETVVQSIDTRQRNGERASDIAAGLAAQMPRIAQWKIERLARTETSKANEAITQARAEYIGLGWYQWLTAEDVRVRLSHRNMDLVLVRYSDPPAPELLVREKSQGHYNAGNIWNCRCTAAPLVDLDEVAWPARVYWHGRIQRMTRAQFAKIAGAKVER